MNFTIFFVVLTIFCWSGLPLRAELVDNASPHAAAATNFDPTIDDMPLMEGLKAVPDQETLFTAPRAGRIVESVATGPVAVNEVYDFYVGTLPHLGWQVVDNRTYHRNGERLRIDAHADGGVTTVRFSIKPDK